MLSDLVALAIGSALGISIARYLNVDAAVGDSFPRLPDDPDEPVTIRTTPRGEFIEVNPVAEYLKEATGDVSLGDVIQDDER